MLLTQTRWHYVAPVSCLPDVSIKNYSRTRLGADIDRSVGRSSGKVQISLLWILELICVWLSRRVVWLTHDTIKWKREGSEDGHYINHQSFPRPPLSIICNCNLMSFVRSGTNFAINITAVSSRLTPEQNQNVSLKMEKTIWKYKTFIVVNVSVL